MRTTVLDLAGISDRETLHRVVAETLTFPPWYGENLDALFDCLTSLPEETALTVENGAALEEALGPYGKHFLRVLREAAEETARFSVTIHDGENPPLPSPCE